MLAIMQDIGLGKISHNERAGIEHEQKEHSERTNLHAVAGSKILLASIPPGKIMDEDRPANALRLKFFARNAGNAAGDDDHTESVKDWHRLSDRSFSFASA